MSMLLNISDVMGVDIKSERAKKHHLNFIQECWQKTDHLIVGEHTRFICNRIDKAIEDYRQGISSRIIIEVPVRHGKSDMVSRYLPPHYLGEFPENEVLVCSYGQTLANSFSRFARKIIKSDKYTKMYPGVRLSPEKSSVENWELDGHNGSTNWAGVGGGITGKGFDLGIIDDFLKDRKEAESQIVRESQWEWFTDVFFTRAAPISITLILATPWHVDDIVGRIESRMNKNSDSYDPEFPAFEIFKFPAKDEKYKGGFLFLERFPAEWYKTRFVLLGTYGAAGLLMCSPTTKGGNLFKTDKVQFIDESELPKDLIFNRGWDLASTEKELIKPEPDFTAGVLSAVKYVLKEGMSQKVPTIYIKHVKRLQAEAPERDRTIKQIADLDGDTVRIGIESVAGYKDTWANIRESLKGLRIVEKIDVAKDKIVRSAPLEPIFEAGNVYLVKGEWNQAFLDEIESFPSGKNDDQVDGLLCSYEMGRVAFDYGTLPSISITHERSINV